MAKDFRDPGEASRAYRPWIPLKQLRTLVPPAFFHLRIGHLRVNETVLSASTGTPNAFELEGCASVDLVICTHGSFSVEMQQGIARVASGGAVVLPPGNRLAVGHRSVVSTGFQPQALAAAAAAMAGLEHSALPFTQYLASFVPLTINAGSQASAIHGLLQYIDTCHAAGEQVAGRLGLDDVLLRLVAGLVFPQLLEAEPRDLGRYQERRGGLAFDELIDYIRANLDQPLRLSDLEARSFYSRRALQYAFREKLGMTPIAWIREQRLAKAKNQLESSTARTLTITEVALACGYRHMSLFSTDFKRRFGVKPSEVRRPPLL